VLEKFKNYKNKEHIGDFKDDEIINMLNGTVQNQEQPLNNKAKFGKLLKAGNGLNTLPIDNTAVNKVYVDSYKKGYQSPMSKEKQDWYNKSSGRIEESMSPLDVIPMGALNTGSKLINNAYKLYSNYNKLADFVNGYELYNDVNNIHVSDISKIEKKGNGGDVKYPLITEGGYDIKRAIELGYEPDGDGHLPSRDYETGQYLKAKNYYTTPMSIINDELLGYKQRQDINGNLYSIPRDQQYPDFDLNNPPARTFKNGGKFVKTLSPIKANSKNKFSFLNDGIFDNSHYVDRLEDNLQEQYNIKSREFQQKYYPEDDQPGGHNDYLDAARHGSAAMYMANENPYFPLLSMGYANLAGAAHEIKGLGETISNPRNTWEKTQQTLKEVKSDLYNNFIGSAVGANPLKTLPEKELQLKSLVDRGKLSILQSKEDKKRNDDARIKQYEENQIVTPGKSLESSIYKNGGKVNTDWEIVQDDNEWELV